MSGGGGRSPPPAPQGAKLLNGQQSGPLKGWRAGGRSPAPPHPWVAGTSSAWPFATQGFACVALLLQGLSIRFTFYLTIRGGSRKKIAKKIIPNVPTRRNV